MRKLLEEGARERVSRRAAVVAGTVGIGAGLAGCYEEPKMTVHEPGKYKGQQDDSLGGAADREQALQQRFQNGQVDR